MLWLQIAHRRVGCGSYQSDVENLELRAADESEIYILEMAHGTYNQDPLDTVVLLCQTHSSRPPDMRVADMWID